MKRGWYGDSWRHSLSAKGIRNKPKKAAYYQRIISSNVTSRLFAEQSAAEQRKRMGSGIDINKRADVAARIASRPISKEEREQLQKERADLPKTSKEALQRIEQKAAAPLESALRIPPRTLGKIQRKEEGEALAKEIETQFLTEQRGREALDEVQRRLEIEELRQGSVQYNPGKVEFLRNAREILVKQFGSGPEKEMLRRERQFGDVRKKAVRSEAAKKGAKTKAKQKKAAEEAVRSVGGLTKEEQERFEKMMADIDSVGKASQNKFDETRRGKKGGRKGNKKQKSTSPSPSEGLTPEEEQRFNEMVEQIKRARFAEATKSKKLKDSQKKSNSKKNTEVPVDI